MIIEDKYECPKPKGKPLGKPKEDEETRSQQVMGAVSQEVILVPRTVYVPYVAQTPTVPVRMLSAQAASAVVDETPPKKGLGGPGPQPEEKKPLGGPAPKPCETTIQEPCAPTTIIELQRANQRLDLLHRLLDRLCDKDNR